ncbi:4'-phosphopantetheinyl transferase EntD [Krasilnikovia cinnamomea]|uniref:4'-phosphopantetheinyl transferase EntD n=1 Tax=Krasilnikovia cinnamomea TaxID=349313 RepID=A0A4Q7ZU74_9ACTN|nr:4'-phosphopantetheinyl transferase superfamily protein [Krasilnikovia cinnamomea]RZU54524.1 4'-phosphopantetheinyl transferase EntD [Krasilnikovia cinnamomea]
MYAADPARLEAALTALLGPEFEVSVAGRAPAGDDGPGAAHRREHRLGRAALRRVADRLGERVDTDRLVLPHPRMTLTHSAGVAVAVGARTSTGIGVDLEAVRPVNPGIARLFLTSAERARLGAAPPHVLLRLWTVKEAVFKADTGNAGRILADYELCRPAAWSGHATRGGSRFRYRTVELPGHLVSVAVHEERTA